MVNQIKQNQFFDAFNKLQIEKLMRKSNTTKSYGVSEYELFQFLLMLVFK